MWLKVVQYFFSILILLNSVYTSDSKGWRFAKNDRQGVNIDDETSADVPSENDKSWFGDVHVFNPIKDHFTMIMSIIGCYTVIILTIGMVYECKHRWNYSGYSEEKVINEESDDSSTDIYSDVEKQPLNNK